LDEVKKMKWNDEYSASREDYQEPPDMRDNASGDMGRSQQESVDEMQRTPLGEPRVEFDVRCVYDSRPLNGGDFNLSITAVDTSTTNWQATFVVPNGYRMVPRKWEVTFDNPPSGPNANSTATIQQNGANLPYNGPIIIGMGTSEPIETFFICEENTTFGIMGNNANFTGGSNVVNVNVYGNLLAATDVALPFEVTNRKYGT
jgi:hypothetical protein